MIDVSVIVPVYNVSGFVERCARSLLDQTLDNVEYIFVDDDSPDNSIDIIRRVVKEYPNRNVRFAIHEYNKGLPSARNTGLDLCVGEYVFHCDADDYVEKTMLEDMYRAAKQSDADIVWCDWFLSFESTERYMSQHINGSAGCFLNGMLDGSIKYNVWNKLVKRAVYQRYGIRFPDGKSMGEDMTMIKIASVSQIAVYIPKAYYHYVKTNLSAMSGKFSEKALDDLRSNSEDVISFVQEHKCVPESSIAFFCQSVKLPFLLTGDKPHYYLWRDWFPESNIYIWKNKGTSLRIRFIQWAASRKLYFIVYVYCRIVQKLVYKYIYK